MSNCDNCNKEVDERSLQVVGKYFVCLACSRGYSEEELLEKLESEE